MKSPYHRLGLLLILTVAVSTIEGGPRPIWVDERPSESIVCHDVSSSSQTTVPNNGRLLRVVPPPKGTLYHGLHPGGEKGEEDAVLEDPSLVSRYANRVGHQPWFIYFPTSGGTRAAAPRMFGSQVSDRRNSTYRRARRNPFHPFDTKNIERRSQEET